MSKKEKKETIKEKVLETVEEAKATVETSDDKPPKEEGTFKIKKVTKPKQLGDEKLVPDLVKVDLSNLKKKKKMPFLHQRQMWAMLLSKNKKTVETAKKWLEKYGKPKKK